MYRALSLRLEAAVRGSQPASGPEPELQEKCTRAEVKVVELKKKMEFLQEINDLQATELGVDDKATKEKESITVTSAGLGLLSFPTLVSQASPQLEGRLSALSMPHVSPLPGLG